MKYYISWIGTLAAIVCPFACFTASIVNWGNTDISILFLLLGIFSLDGMSKVTFPKRDSNKNA
mgnify:CR=1